MTNPIATTIREKKEEFKDKFPILEGRVAGVPYENAHWDARPEVKSFLDSFALDIIRAVRESVKSEMNKEHKCQHRSDDQNYDCTDIHIGREEMASDILSTLSEAEQIITNNEG